MSKRLDDLSSNFRVFNEAINRRMSDLEGRIDSKFVWTLGILIPMWVTIILAIIFPT